MDGRGDGEHNGRNRPNFPRQLFPRVDRPPADQLNAGVIAWLEFLFNNELQEEGFAFILEIVEPEDEEQHDDNNNNNENADNNENVENNDNNANDENNDNANDENPDNDSNENNASSGNRDIAVNLNNNDDIHNDNIDDNVDNNNGHTYAGTSAGVVVDQGVEEDDPLLGPSRRRSREEDGQNAVEESSKRIRGWDGFSDSSTDCNSDSDNNTDHDNNNTVRNTRNSPDKHAGADAEVAEEDPLPGPSRKSSRELDTVEDERSDEKSRLCYEFADDTVTIRTNRDLAHGSSSIDPDDNAGAAEETGEETNQQVEEEATQPGP
ncbi:glycosyltransferase-like protein gnt13 [Seriola aureovittata]|uniref:glycosyltransferase-like protein gnt13 n=1 Tax=Seriola aureovittata TaxID=2871759 RepID=UPI0024BE02A3|nr:glycosyltransferase-like protein gnt13 [Seriola aureovittata]XP_056221975.1 glycosyltransferase-like protein gnt13 [Seriola aureovittata]XP_056221976.1 glycosyltransferase-like protein gnt13 [Seriola aureovittata]